MKSPYVSIAINACDNYVHLDHFGENMALVTSADRCRTLKVSDASMERVAMMCSRYIVGLWNEHLPVNVLSTYPYLRGNGWRVTIRRSMLNKYLSQLKKDN